MPQPTAQAQEMLELVNRMRRAPAAELNLLLNSGDPKIAQALQQFGVDRTLLAQQWSGLVPVAPLAWSAELATSAAGHNQQMIVTDTQAHQLTGEAGIYDRAVNAGYVGTRIGENIFAFSESVLYGHAGFAIDWGNDPKSIGGIQNPAGHRELLLSGNYRELGIAITAENNPSTAVGPLVITQDFGNRTALDGKAWLLGVAFQDLNKNSFYDAGEGVGGIDVEVQAASQPTSTPIITTTWDAGGYQTLLTPGQYQVKFLKNKQLISSQNITIDPTTPANIKTDLLLSDPTISIGNVSAVEGNTGNVTYNFAVNLSNPSLKLVTVNYATADQTATVANNDFLATSGTLNFAPGETSKNIAVSVVGDLSIEDIETFAVNLTAAVNSSIKIGQGIGTILNDDFPPVPTSLLPKLEPLANNLLQVVNNSASFNLKFTPLQRLGAGADDLGVFAVDDEQGKIGALLPGQAGYLQAALDRSQTIFSTLGGAFFDPTVSRQLTFQAGQRLRFFAVKDDTINSAKAILANGGTPNNIVLGDNSLLPITNIGDKLNLAWSGTSSNLLIQAELSSQPTATGTALQDKLDLLDISSKVGPVAAAFTVQSDAFYKNRVGFYTVDDAFTGRVGTLLPGDVGYAQAAINRAVVALDSVSGSVVSNTQNLAGGTVLAPFLIADGKATYFAYIGANTDKVDHIKLLGDNRFGFEDMAGGGDRDYNDVVLGVKFN
jgi:Calx-beta domain/Domain of unknown function (DUF4114)/SdrD B-like domain/Cysteine-rich secretory protein family